MPRPVNFGRNHGMDSQSLNERLAQSTWFRLGEPHCDYLFPFGYANISLGLAPCKRFRSLETTPRMVAAFAADFKRVLAKISLSKSTSNDRSDPPPSATSPALE